MNKLIWNAFADELEKVGAVEKLLRPPPGWVSVGKNWVHSKSGKMMPAGFDTMRSAAPTQVTRKIKPGRQIARSDMPGRFILPQ